MTHAGCPIAPQLKQHTFGSLVAPSSSGHAVPQRARWRCCGKTQSSSGASGASGSDAACMHLMYLAFISDDGGDSLQSCKPVNLFLLLRKELWVNNCSVSQTEIYPVQNWSLAMQQELSSRLQPQCWIEFLDPWVHYFYPVLGWGLATS